MNSQDYLKNQYSQLSEVHDKLEAQVARGFSNYLNDQDLGKLKLEKLTVKRELDKLKKGLSNEKSV